MLAMNWRPGKILILHAAVVGPPPSHLKELDSARHLTDRPLLGARKIVGDVVRQWRWWEELMGAIRHGPVQNAQKRHHEQVAPLSC
jgi:hypothetical protein